MPKYQLADSSAVLKARSQETLRNSSPHSTFNLASDSDYSFVCRVRMSGKICRGLLND